jgi:hypothetical protein
MVPENLLLPERSAEHHGHRSHDLAHPRTLRRWVLMRDADLLLTPSHLLVVLAFTERCAARSDGSRI